MPKTQYLPGLQTTFSMQALHHKQVLIGEQLIGVVNPLFQMATITYTPQQTAFSPAHISTQYALQAH
jgi:hypothetical protein